jgi:hypothetical protein
MRESTLDHWRLLSQAWTLSQEDEKAISTSTRFQVKIVRGRAQPFTSSRSSIEAPFWVAPAVRLKNTERQPDVKNLDLRLSWTTTLGRGLSLELMGEVFNLTNEANWYVSTDQQYLVDRDGSIIDEFGEPDRVGAPRRFQVGARLRF